MKAEIRLGKNHKEFLPYNYMEVSDQFYAPDVLATRGIAWYLCMRS